MLDAVVVGSLTAAAAVVSVVMWQLYVHPEVFLGLWSSEADNEWLDAYPGAIAALRIAGAIVMLLLGFLTGLALSFFAGT